MSEELNNETSIEIESAPEAVVEESVAEVIEEEAVEPVVVEDAVVSSEPKTTSTKPGLGPVGDGAMGSTRVSVEPKKKAVAKEVAKPETVAVFSTRNITWSGVGKVYRGYNIVTKEQAEKWLTRDHIRPATPAEVAKEFGL